MSHMAVVKITNKQLLNDLQAKLTLQLGRKVSQQEIIDLCVNYASQNFDTIVKFASNRPQLTPEKAHEIIQRTERFRSIPYNKKGQFTNKDDQEIYNF
jgi:hypothetical protein